MTAIRLSENLRRSIDKWATQQSDRPPRSEAIRRLVELGLEVKPGHKAPAQNRVARRSRTQAASEMANRTVDKLRDETAPVEEQAKRKRRLVKGPLEFRDIRKDQFGSKPRTRQKEGKH